MSGRSFETAFVLSVYDIEAGLKAAGRIGGFRKKSLVQSLLLAFGCLLFSYYAFLEPENPMYSAVAVLAGAFAAAAWAVPALREKNLVKKAYTGREVRVRFSEDEGTLTVFPEGRDPWALDLSRPPETRDGREVFTVFLESGRLLILPKRAFAPEDLAAAAAMLGVEDAGSRT